MTTRRPRRSSAAVACAALCLFLVPGLASAHAELDTMTPADKSSGPAPAAIVATFTETLTASKSSLTLVDAGGAVVADGGAVDSATQKQMTLTLPALAPGAYTIRWTSTSSADGDLARGVTTFTVVAASPSPATPSPAPSTASTAPSVAASVAPSATVASSSSAPAPSPSDAPTTPATSTSDAVVPIVVALVVLAALGLWLVRGRARRPPPG